MVCRSTIPQTSSARIQKRGRSASSTCGIANVANSSTSAGTGWTYTHCNLPVYLGVTVDRTLSYKAHIEKTTKKGGTRNNIIRKLRTSTWGATPTTLRASALALCYSAAGYACPVWERSTHSKKLDATLYETSRMITGCLKPTNTNSLPVLAGIAPSDIRRAVASRTERTRQTTDQRLNGHLGVVPRLKSRKSFIKCTEPINTTAKATRMELWRERLEPLDASVHLNISPDEHLPAGAENPWTTWKALNRLRTQVGRSRVNMLKWGFSKEQDTCDCGIRQTMQHILVCPMMDTACSPKTWQRLTASPSAVPSIGRARFDEHTTPGGRTIMMMSDATNEHIISLPLFHIIMNVCITNIWYIFFPDLAQCLLSTC